MRHRIVALLLTSLALQPLPARSTVLLKAEGFCETFPYCGASIALGQQWMSDWATYEALSVQIDISAHDLLQSSGEHIAIATNAVGVPFSARGNWQANSPNGGVGVVLGRIDSSFWPACREDPLDRYIEFAIESFGWGGTRDTRILGCSRFPKTRYTAGVLRIEMVVSCKNQICDISASVRNLQTPGVLAAVASEFVPLDNPTGNRVTWVGMLNASRRAIQLEVNPLSAVRVEEAVAPKP